MIWLYFNTVTLIIVKPLAVSYDPYSLGTESRERFWA